MLYTTRLQLLCAAGLVATSSLPAQQAVPLRDITTIDARSRQTFGNIFGVRPLAGGGVLVNDGVRRQLVALDGNLANRRVVIDSASEGGNSYGPRPAPLIPYLGDSSLFVDGASLTLLVLDPAGKVARVMAAPKPSDMRFLAGSASGIDANGNLIYEGITVMNGRGMMRDPTRAMAPIQSPDSAPIVRANFEARTVDTLGRVKNQGGGTLALSRGPDGALKATRTINPLETIDEWAVLSDGSVAFIRGHDYHIDWIRPDGSTFSSPKLPFDWKRLTDDDKQRLIDSARTAMGREAPVGRGGGAGTSSAGGTGPAPGASGEFRVSSGTGAGPAGAGAPPPQPIMMSPPTPTIEFVPIKAIADYYPPIRSGAAQADRDGRLWILPTTSAQSKAGELVYDVVDNQGRLTQRVRVPAGRSIAGFGPNGVVYLMSREAPGAWILERATLPAR